MWTDRSAVYVVRANADFLPQSPWNFPETFSDAELRVKNLPLEDARAMVRTMNKTAIEAWQIDHEAWNRQWAIVVACPRAKGIDRRIRVVSANLGKAKGGAA
jgi:hypothetical protein